MWIWIGSILLLLLIVIGLILMSKITLQLRAVKQNWDDSIILDVTMLFGLISLHYEVPTVVLKSWQEGIWYEKSQNDNILSGHASSGEQVIDQEKLQMWKEEFRKILKNTKGLMKWMKVTMKRVTIRNLDWSTNIALEDAAYTATLTGILWGIKSSLIGFLTYQASFAKRPKIFVVPIFDSRPMFVTEVNCSAYIRLGHAIYAGIVLIVRVLKVKGGIRKWLGILLKNQ
ncbi:hypothetical protein D3C76_149160 [compost metagenome]